MYTNVSQQGDKVEYRPVGGKYIYVKGQPCIHTWLARAGATENVSHSTGTIASVSEAEDGVSLVFLVCSDDEADIDTL